NSPSVLDVGKQSRRISQVLAPALRFWLRSQLDHVEDLCLTISAGDRQVLSGAVGEVCLAAQKAVYQGLHVSQVQVRAVGIRTNLGQVIRGKPFRLLEPFPVAGNLILQEADLTASLQAPLLAQAVIDFLLPLLTANADLLSPSQDLQVLRFDYVTIQIEPGHVTLTANLLDINHAAIPITFRTGLAIEQGNQLHLRQPVWLHRELSRPLPDQVFYLGEQVYLDYLILDFGQIYCRGQVTVIPG
ncbi:MAG TPA: DUF2993 domain-containing protein, partial [Coleofasciculaceae cyanobacterium]